MLSRIFQSKKKGFTCRNPALFQKGRALGGFTLLEVIIAILVISIGLIGVINVIPQLFYSTSINSSRLAAAYLAQEGIEIVRNIRDTNWLEGSNWNDGLTICEPPTNCCEVDYDDGVLISLTLCGYSNLHYLNINSTNGFYSYSPGEQTKFKRKITITPEGIDLKVSVDIFWEERGKSYQFSVQEKLYQWY